jgi:hypothetical protein
MGPITGDNATQATVDLRKDRRERAILNIGGRAFGLATIEGECPIIRRGRAECKTLPFVAAHIPQPLLEKNAPPVAQYSHAVAMKALGAEGLRFTCRPQLIVSSANG